MLKAINAIGTPLQVIHGAVIGQRTTYTNAENLAATQEANILALKTEFLAMKGLERMMRTLTIMQKSRPGGFKVTIVPTMYDKRTKASLQTLMQLKIDYPNQVWTSAVPIDTKFRDASLKHLPASHFASGSRGVFAYKQLLIYLERLAFDEQ